MIIKNEGKLAEVLLEFGLELPDEFDLDDEIVAACHAEISDQGTHPHIEQSHREAIGLARSASLVYRKKPTAGAVSFSVPVQPAVFAPSPVFDDTTGREIIALLSQIAQNTGRPNPMSGRILLSVAVVIFILAVALLK